MKSILFALIGVSMYAIQNAMIDIKLKQYSTISILLGLYTVLFPLVIGLVIYQKLTGGQVTLPTGEGLRYIIIVSISFFIADFFYVGAYTAGGDVVTITILLVLMPVIGALVKFLWVHEIPITHHIIGFIFAALAVIFIAFGSKEKELKDEKQTTVIEVKN